MTKNSNKLLALTVGKLTVAKNLQNAVEAGKLLQNEDGTFEFPPPVSSTSTWLNVYKIPHLDCQFLNDFLFDCAYAESAVPFGCRECYKVTVTPKTLRQLMALRSIQEKIPCTSKCGVALSQPTTQNIYSGIFYCIGLDKARGVYKTVSDALNDDANLGPDVPVQIKRGCTHFEIKLGPSDKYEFRAELPELEDYLRSRFKHPLKTKANKMHGKLATFANWIQTAFQIGDDTYLDFTGGKRLYPKLVSYDPDPDNNNNKS